MQKPLLTLTPAGIKFIKRSLFILGLMLVLTAWFSPVFHPVQAVPHTEYDPPGQVQEAAIASLEEFVNSLPEANADTVVGVYVPAAFAFPVVQQPGGRPEFVSTKPEVITQFSLAANYGTIGLLAHNNLAGATFSALKELQKVILVRGDHSLEPYYIDTIERYRALTPNSPYSSFIDLDSPGKTHSVESVFYRIYGAGERVVFQTCIESDGILSWGRLFITALPLNNPASLSWRGFGKHLLQ